MKYERNEREYESILPCKNIQHNVGVLFAKASLSVSTTEIDIKLEYVFFF